MGPICAPISIHRVGPNSAPITKQDRSLTLLSAVQVARGPQPMHTIYYNPVTVAEPDYVICYQCGFILRLFRTSLKRYATASKPFIA